MNMNHDEINFDMRKVFKSLLKEFKESAIRMFSGMAESSIDEVLHV